MLTLKDNLYLGTAECTQKRDTPGAGIWNLSAHSPALDLTSLKLMIRPSLVPRPPPFFVVCFVIIHKCLRIKTTLVKSLAEVLLKPRSQALPAYCKRRKAGWGLGTRLVFLCAPKLPSYQTSTDWQTLHSALPPSSSGKGGVWGQTTTLIIPIDLQIWLSLDSRAHKNRWLEEKRVTP